MKLATLAIVLLVLLLSLVGGCALSADAEPNAQAAKEQAPLTVFLVRHAEKLEDSRDPDLSAAGKERAGTLASVLKDATIDHVHSSDYIRTRDTAAPFAKAQGLEVELYDPRELDSFADALRSAGGRHLVVGHSNTTPSMAGLLGGVAGEPIDEKGEYDRLYIVTAGADGTVQSTLLRYGRAFVPPPAKPSQP